MAECSVPHPSGHESALRTSNILIGELNAAFAVPRNRNRSRAVIVGSGIIFRVGVIVLVSEETGDVGLARVRAEVISFLAELEGSGERACRRVRGIKNFDSLGYAR